MTLSIKGTDYEIQIVSDAAYKKLLGSGSAALTDRENKVMIFNEKFITAGTVRHELLHAIYGETHVESADLAPDEVEEIFASIVDYQFNNIILWTEQILNKVLSKNNKSKTKDIYERERNKRA